jgi:hypothetical protein
MHTISSRARTLAGAVASAALFLVVLLGASPAGAATSTHTFAVHAGNISGAPTGAVAMTGGGFYDASRGVMHAAGAFRCVSDVNQGPLAGCRAGEGIRWSSEELLPSTGFKCTASATEALKTANTSDDTAVFRAQFFRAGDLRGPSFQANVLVSRRDVAGDVAGVQNVWIQAVGCANGIAIVTP